MGTARSCVLALDQGGHASRALLFDNQGRILAQAERRIGTQRRGPARVEHAASAVLRSLRQAAEAAIQELPHGTVIRAAALATQRSSIACWDRTGITPLSPVLSWQDRRAAREVAALASHTARVRRLTGLVLSPHYGASKIAWCLRHLPEVRRAAKEHRLAAGPLASFLVAGLTQEQACLADPVNGARTQLLDIGRGQWSEALCRLFGVPPVILPACVPNRHAFGILHIAGRDIPLTVVTGDQPAALFARGEPESGVAYMNLGTGAFVQCLGSVSAPGMLRSLLWRDGIRALYAMEGTVNGAGAALDAMTEKLGLRPAAVLRALPEWLDDAEDPPIFLNGIGGLGAPYWRPDFRSRFVGSGGGAARMAAVAESVVFLLLANLRRMQQAGVAFRRIQVSGGLARFDGLCQRLADLSGLPVERPDLHEATALGLVHLAGGIEAAADARGVRFEPLDAPALMERERRWRRALAAALA
jgi:glycerol kinase